MFNHTISRGLFLFALMAFGCESGQDIAPVNPQGGTNGSGGVTGSGGATPIQCDTPSDCPSGQLWDDGQCIDCADDATCRLEFGGQFGCLEGRCIEVCTPGALDCICDDGECDRGLLCQENQCESCIDGVDGCPCREGDSPCDEGLFCDPERGCEPCLDGRVGCPCAEGNTCETGGYCQAGACMPCNAGVIGCPCDETDNCTGRLICDDETTSAGSRAPATRSTACFTNCAPRMKTEVWSALTSVRTAMSGYREKMYVL